MENKNEIENSIPKGNKPIYKKWWFWVVVLAAIGVVGQGRYEYNVETQPSSIYKTNEVQIDKKIEKKVEEKDSQGFTYIDRTKMMSITRFILDKYLTKYKISVLDDEWMFMRFDDKGAVMTIADVELKNSSFKQRMFCIFDYDTSEGVDNPKFREHFTLLGNDILYNDGYADEFLNQIATIGN